MKSVDQFPGSISISINSIFLCPNFSFLFRNSTSSYILTSSISRGFSTILQRGKRVVTSHPVIFYDSVRQKTNLQLAVTFIGQSQTLRITFYFTVLCIFYWSCVSRRPSDKNLATKLVIINIIDLEINVFIHNYFTTDEFEVLRSEMI